MEREKWKTAGRHMNTLVGDALDQDEQFWDHSSWKEQDDEMSGADGSYDVADEAKEDVVDRFDSDFNDSESSEDENDGEGAIEDDIRNVKRKSVYSDPNATRKLKSGSKMYKKDNRKSQRIQQVMIPSRRSRRAYTVVKSEAA